MYGGLEEHRNGKHLAIDYDFLKGIYIEVLEINAWFNTFMEKKKPVPL